MASVQSLKWSSLRPLLFFQNRAWSYFGEILESSEKCTDEKAQKKWVFAHFHETKVGLKNRLHFLKTALFRRFLPLFGRFAQIRREKFEKSPLAHFYFYLIVIKRLKIYINRAYKSGFLTIDIKKKKKAPYHKRKMMSIVFRKYLSFLFYLCYTKRATQSNTRLSYGKILLKSVFSLYLYHNWDEIV